MQAIRYLFQQPSDSSIQRNKNASLSPVVFCFTLFKQVHFVMFIHLPKFLISAIQAGGFTCRPGVLGCGGDRFEG